MMDARHSPCVRGVMHYFASPLIEQAFSNYAAMTDADRELYAARIAKFHRNTKTQSPFTVGVAA